MMNKPLVAYFSASGTTAKAAAVLAQAAKADIYEIVPETPYTPADLDWTDRSSRTTKEKNDPSFRPAIGGKSIDVSSYDTIYLGFPIWWYTAPSIIKTFFGKPRFFRQDDRTLRYVRRQRPRQHSQRPAAVLSRCDD